MNEQISNQMCQFIAAPNPQGLACKYVKMTRDSWTTLFDQVMICI